MSTLHKALAAFAALLPGAAAAGTLCTITNEQACCSGNSMCSWSGCGGSGSASDNAGICQGTYTGTSLAVLPPQGP